MKNYDFKDRDADTYFCKEAENIDAAWEALCDEHGAGYTMHNIFQITKQEWLTAGYKDLRDFMWDVLEGHGVSEQTLRVATDIAGYSEETLCAVLESVTGYKDFFEFL